jgi:putative addiction module component (TIGR02574 family)
MSAAEIKELRKGIKKQIDHADERVVKMVYAMLEADAVHEASVSLTSDQEAMLKERIKKYEKGHTKFSTWDEVEKRIVSRAQNAI